MAKTNKEKEASFLGPYTNIFESIIDDPIEAADLKFRADMMMALTSLIEARGLKQKEVAKVLGVPQPRVSELMRGKISKVSSDKLIYYAKRLGFELKPKFESEKISVEVVEN